MLTRLRSSSSISSQGWAAASTPSTVQRLRHNLRMKARDNDYLNLSCWPDAQGDIGSVSAL
eukprot:3367333-Heterocapsa_arctica.AAC.1